MAEYHVGAGMTGIFAGTLNKKGDMWLHKSDVTDEAECAVRDFMVNELLGGLDCSKVESNGYQWKLKDGRIVELRITIIGEKNENTD